MGGVAHVVTGPRRSRWARKGTTQNAAKPTAAAPAIRSRRHVAARGRSVASSAARRNAPNTMTMNTVITWMSATAAKLPAQRTGHRHDGRPGGSGSSVKVRSAAPSANRENTAATC